MKIYIIQEADKYPIIKVSNDLVEDFRKKMGEKVFVEGKDIQEAVTKFSDFKKADMTFDPELKKYRPEQKLRHKDSRL